MPDNLKQVAAANPPVAPLPHPDTVPDIYSNLRVFPYLAAATTGALAGWTAAKNLVGQVKDIASDPEKFKLTTRDMILGMVGTGEFGEGDSIVPGGNLSEVGSDLEGAAKKLYEGLRVRKANEVMVQPQSTSRATPTGEGGSVPPEVHADLEKQAGRTLSSEEAVSLDRANLERGMLSAPRGNTAEIREAKRSELEKPDAAKLAKDAGVVYKGELVRGSDVHMFEHPDHPGKTMAANGKDLSTPEALKERVDAKVAQFKPKGKMYYHGTRGDVQNISQLDSTSHGRAGLSGVGTYVTDKPEVAASSGYGGKRGGRVLGARLSPGANILDAEKPLSPELHERMMNKVRALAKGLYPDEDPDTVIGEHFNLPGKGKTSSYMDIMDGAKRMLFQYSEDVGGLPDYEGNERLMEIQGSLAESGIHGVRYAGGKRVGGLGEHEAVMVFPGKEKEVLSPEIPAKFRQNAAATESMDDPDTRLSTARHEAGHAVVSEILRPQSVQEVGLDDHGGYTNISRPGGKTDPADLTPDEIRNLVSVSYAGGLSEPGGTTAQHVGPDRARRGAILGGGAATPTANLERLLTGRTLGADKFLGANTEQAESRARLSAILADPKTRDKIDRLAGKINETGKMTGGEVRKYLESLK